MSQTPLDLAAQIRGLKHRLKVHRLLKRGQATITDDELESLDQNHDLYSQHMSQYRLEHPVVQRDAYLHGHGLQGLGGVFLRDDAGDDIIEDRYERYGVNDNSNDPADVFDSLTQDQQKEVARAYGLHHARRIADIESRLQDLRDRAPAHREEHAVMLARLAHEQCN